MGIGVIAWEGEVNVAAHGKLANPLVVEVVLEVRFTTDRLLDAYIEQFSQKIKSSYPSRKRMNVVGFELNLDKIDSNKQPLMRVLDDDAANVNTPRYRFDGYRGIAIQIGERVLSIHHTSYEGFGAFIADARKILDLHKNYSALKKYTGFRLRYLNLIPMGEDGIKPSDYLSWGMPDPPEAEDLVDIQSMQNMQQVVAQYGGHGIQRVHFAVPFQLGHRSGLLIDIDHTAEEQQFPFITQEGIMQNWVDQAHEYIWNSFVSSLKPQYFEELKNDFIPN